MASSLTTSPYERACEAFSKGDYRTALTVFELIAKDLPEVWLPALRCHEQLKDEIGAAAARDSLRNAADAGDWPACYAYHLLIRDTALRSPNQREVEQSRHYLRRAAAGGFGPAVDQLRDDKMTGLA
jgi:TPR repeat protein